MNDEYFSIVGKMPLVGRTEIPSAKNAVLPMLAAGILSDGGVTLLNCPDLTDVDNMLRILTSLGLYAMRNGRSVSVSGKPSGGVVPEFLACAMRSSVFLLGPLLSELGEVRLYTPGGCNIGARPVDIHLDGLRRMGAAVEYADGCVICSAKKLKGADIVLKYPSVGATENLIAAAVKAKGKTTLVNVAREPEITSFCKLLGLMGADISGEGTPVVRINGVDELGDAIFEPVPDRIVAGTLLCALAVTGGKLTLDNCKLSDLGAVVKKLVSPHFTVTDGCGEVTAESDGIVLPCDVATGPFPLFPTDMQAPFTAVQCFGGGISQISETVFENRFAHVGELLKMGASIDVDGDTATVRGVPLHGAELNAPDLRGGAGLVIAALGAEGESKVRGLKHIDRGYEGLENVLSSLGAKIVRKNAFNPPNPSN